MTRTVVVTGASAGVGRAVAHAYAAAAPGWRCWPGARRAWPPPSGSAALRGATDVRVYRVDVADAGAVQQAADDVVARGSAASTCGSTTRWRRCSRRPGRSRPSSSAGSPRSPTWARCTAPSPRCGTCGRTGGARSCRWARRWPTGGSRCSRRTARASTPSRGSTTRCAPSCCTTAPRVKLSMVQLPAVNTPQFSWVRTRLPRHPQPVPPIFTPEVAARAIAVGRRPRHQGAQRRRPDAGRPGWATSSFPGLLDREVGPRRLRQPSRPAQQIEPATWRDNLDAPADETAGATAPIGVFHDRARDRSRSPLWATTTKPALSGPLAAGGALAAVALVRDPPAPLTECPT